MVNGHDVVLDLPYSLPMAICSVIIRVYATYCHSEACLSFEKAAKILYFDARSIYGDTI